jgi:hypothetical protein
MDLDFGRGMHPDSCCNIIAYASGHGKTLNNLRCEDTDLRNQKIVFPHRKHHVWQPNTVGPDGFAIFVNKRLEKTKTLEH